jgi:hypothetical protein
MINVEIEWGTTTTEIQHPPASFARHFGEFFGQLEEGRTRGTYTISHNGPDVVISYADVRKVTCTWTKR